MSKRNNECGRSADENVWRWSGGDWGIGRARKHPETRRMGQPARLKRHECILSARGIVVKRYYRACDCSLFVWFIWLSSLSCFFRLSGWQTGTPKKPDEPNKPNKPVWPVALLSPLSLFPRVPLFALFPPVSLVQHPELPTQNSEPITQNFSGDSALSWLPSHRSSGPQHRALTGPEQRLADAGKP